MMEMIGSGLAEANIGYQSKRNSSQIDQTEQEAAMTAGYETREIHVDKEGMDIYGVVHITSGTEGKMPTVIMSHELGATLDRVKGYGDVHEMFDSPEEIPETHSLLGFRLGNQYFVDIWDQEPYERIKEYEKIFF